MSRPDLLQFKFRDLRPALQQLFNRLDQESAAVATFATDPMGELLTSLLPEVAAATSPAEISAANRFLFSVIANKEFARWISEYQSTFAARLEDPANADKPLHEIIDRQTAIRELAQAFIDFGDTALLANYTESLALSRGIHSAGPVSHEIAVVTAAVALVLVVVTAIDATPRVPDPSLAFTAPDLRAVADSLIATAQRRSL